MDSFQNDHLNIHVAALNSLNWLAKPRQQVNNSHCAHLLVKAECRPQQDTVYTLWTWQIIALQPNHFYYPTSNEKAIFHAAVASRLPLMLKGPTGCGKTRFVEHMAWQLGRPLITIACHEDMTAADLAGRYLLNAEGTLWNDGPLTIAVRYGAICYLDEWSKRSRIPR